jgi:hypothetical protein
MEFATFLFGWLGLGSAVIHYEFEYYYEIGDDPESSIMSYDVIH